MPVAGTTIGPINTETRDKLRDYRDQEGYPNYNAAVRALLQKADEEADTQD